MSVIIKVQRPIISTATTDVPWLVYEGEKRNLQQVPASAIPKHVKDQLGEDFIGYFTGDYSATTGWQIGNRVSRGRRI